MKSACELLGLDPMYVANEGTFLCVCDEEISDEVLEILQRVKIVLKIFPFLTIILFAIGGIFLQFIPCYKIVSFAGSLAQSNPLAKEVIMQKGCWYNNYNQYSWMIIAPALAFIAQFFTLIFSYKNLFGKAFISSALGIFGIIATVGLTMFPFILPSSLNPSASLTVWDASSSEFTLTVMLIAALIFVPIILAYTSWVFVVLKGKVTEKDIKKDSKFLY